MFVLTLNTPGYMPEDVPAEFETFDEAMSAARDEIEQLVAVGMEFISDLRIRDEGSYRADFRDPSKTHDLSLILEITEVER